MARYIKFTEEKIQRMEADGFGCGVGASFKPWIEVTSVSSSGRSRRIFSSKTGRTHHLLSDVELDLFIALEWQQDVVDIREQFPLDRATTLSVAQKIGITHPYYPGTQVPTVMTIDFLVTKRVGVKDVLVAFNAKRTEEAQDERSMLKLEIQRATLALLDVEHHVVFHGDIPFDNIRNINWIRDGLLRLDETEKYHDFWEPTKVALRTFLLSSGKVTLAQACQQFDHETGHETGTGLRAAKLLLWDRLISAELSRYPIADIPITDFKFPRTQTAIIHGGRR